MAQRLPSSAVRFLILHGLAGSGPDHWQTWLAARLRAGGHDVRYPDLPDPDAPDLAAWLVALDRERASDQVVVCHSLACCLWLHHRARGGAAADRVLLVAPPCPDSGVPEIAGFFPVPREPALADGARLVCSDADPYCAMGTVAYYGALQAPVDVIPGGGHLNPEAGLGPWPAVEAWCQGAKNGVET
jgi:hypothetical protein